MGTPRRLGICVTSLASGSLAEDREHAAVDPAGRGRAFLEVLDRHPVVERTMPALVPVRRQVTCLADTGARRCIVVARSRHGLEDRLEPPARDRAEALE